MQMRDAERLFDIRPDRPGSFKLTGELSFRSALSALNQTAVYFLEPTNKMVFDLAEIVKADSAGLALLLEWLRLASLNGMDLHYINLPKQLLAMAQVAGVDGILVID